MEQQQAQFSTKRAKGVPISTAGITEGKNDINARIRYYKVGVDLKTEKPASGEIKIKTEGMLVDKTFKNNASRLQSLVIKYIYLIITF